MFTRLYVLFLGLSLTCTALAQAGRSGPAGSGGGDRCENRAKVILKDIKAWVEAGGGGGLKFDGLRRLSDAVDYQTRMTQVLTRPTRIKCVVPGDQDYPVLVNGKPKECRSFVDNEGINQIICDRARFYVGTNPEEDPAQYTMMHHELATLAELELPIADDSEYLLSNQLTEYLENRIVKRLALKKPASNQASGEFRLPADTKVEQCVEMVVKHELKSRDLESTFRASNFQYHRPWHILGSRFAQSPYGTFEARDEMNRKYTARIYVSFEKKFDYVANGKSFYRSCKMTPDLCGDAAASLQIRSESGDAVYSSSNNGICVSWPILF